MKTEPLSPVEATEAGYVPMTIGYELPKEDWMLESVVADMDRGHIDARLIEIAPSVVEVWRKPSATHAPLQA